MSKNKPKIKTRIEARTASIEKWEPLAIRLEELQNEVESMCGFCDLAQYKTEGKEPKVYRCRLCESDAEKLCCEYITDDQLITNPLTEAKNLIYRLIKEIKALPDVLKEE